MEIDSTHLAFKVYGLRRTGSKRVRGKGVRSAASEGEARIYYKAKVEKVLSSTNKKKK